MADKILKLKNHPVQPLTVLNLLKKVHKFLSLKNTLLLTQINTNQAQDLMKELQL